MVTEKIFEAALSISSPWYIAGMNFDEQQRKLHIRVDFEVGSRFTVPRQSGEHPVHDTVTKTYRHLNFFQHECELEVRVPRVKLPDGKVTLGEPTVGGQALGIHAAVRSLCAAAVPRDVLLGCGAHHRGVGTSSDGAVRAVCQCGGGGRGLQ